MFDKEKFIQCVQEHPQIWNKSCKGYNNLRAREKSWYDIGEIMFDDWEDIADEEKQDLVKDMKTKWRHMRDSFHKYVNQERKGDPALKKKKYMYANLLSFLLQSFSRRSTSDDAYHDEEDYLSQTFYEKEDSSETDVKETIFKSSTKRTSVPKISNVKIAKTVRDFEEKSSENANKRHIDEEDPDRSFLMSILGDIKKLNDEEKLDFRLHTLQFFRDVQRKRKIPPTTEPEQFSD